MSSLQLPERPAFNSIESGFDSELAAPVSRLAILSLLLGMAALTAALTINVLPLAVVVAVLCAAVTWRLSGDNSVSGLRLAQIGLCFAVTGSVWGVTSLRTRDVYLYSLAGEHAKVFLDKLSEGNKYEAFELTLTEADRQITGTNITEHYEQLLSAPPIPSRRDSMPDPSSMEMPSSQAMQDGRVRESLNEFLSAESTQEILTHGSEAQWALVRGLGINWTASTVAQIQVILVDKAKPTRPMRVQLSRKLGIYLPEPGKPPVAIWNIDRAQVFKE